MKRIIALMLAAVLSLCSLSSCAIGYKENVWYSDDYLSECLVPDLPQIDKSYVNKNGEDIYVSLTENESKAYAKTVYDYLCLQNYRYLGTRGEQMNTLAGALTTYYFQPADYFSQFFINGDYVFVFSDGSVNEDSEIEFNILTIYDVSKNVLEYGSKEFTYNTIISLRKGSETPLNGFYTLPGDGDHEHIFGEWYYGEEYHWRSVDCTWDMCDIDTTEEHYDDDGDGKCDACGYEYGK